MRTSTPTTILDGEYQREDAWGEENGLTKRAVGDYRKRRGLPYITWRKSIYIHVPGAKEWARSQVRRDANGTNGEAKGQK
jgi:hypothetical protein